MHIISVARDFSRFPAGRKIAHSKTSGEAFRQKFLDPVVRDQVPVQIDLDGVVGYGSSFLEEAFGGLVREFNLTQQQFNNLVRLQTRSASLRLEVEEYVRKAAEEAARPGRR